MYATQKTMPLLKLRFFFYWTVREWRNLTKAVWSKNDVTYEYILVQVLFRHTERIRIFIGMDRRIRTCCKLVLRLVKLEWLLSEKAAIICVFVGNLWKNFVLPTNVNKCMAILPLQMTNYNKYHLHHMVARLANHAGKYMSIM